MALYFEYEEPFIPNSSARNTKKFQVGDMVRWHNPLYRTSSDGSIGLIYGKIEEEAYRSYRILWLHGDIEERYGLYFNYDYYLQPFSR